MHTGKNLDDLCRYEMSFIRKKKAARDDRTSFEMVVWELRMTCEEVPRLQTDKTQTQEQHLNCCKVLS